MAQGRLDPTLAAQYGARQAWGRGVGPDSLPSAQDRVMSAMSAKEAIARRGQVGEAHVGPLWLLRRDRDRPFPPGRG